LSHGHKQSAVAVLDRRGEKVPSIFPTGDAYGNQTLFQIIEKKGDLSNSI